MTQKETSPGAGDRHLTPLLWLWLADFVGYFAAFVLAYQIRHGLLLAWLPIRPGQELGGWSWHLVLGLVASCLGTLIFERWGFYRSRFGLDRQVHIVQLISAVLFTYLILHFPLLMARTWLSLPVLGLAAGLTLLFVSITHIVFRLLQPWMQARGIGCERTLLVGSATDCNSVAYRLREHYGSQFPVLGYLSADTTTPGGVRRLGAPRHLARLLRSQRVDHVLLATDTMDNADLMAVVETCAEHNVVCRVLPATFEQITGRMTVGESEGIPAITLGDTPLAGSGAVVKRIEDIAVSLVGLVVCGIAFVIFAPLIKLSSRGPIFYRQERVGLDGQVFRMYKFRTMVADAECATGPVWASAGDSRRTWVGSFMRRTNIDELPQFYNVLRGDMSVVGPRPERPHFINQFKRHIPRYMRRHLVKGGLTGWAQVSGLRGNTSIEERTQADIWYIENWTLGLDIRIIWLTIWNTILKNTNAY